MSDAVTTTNKDFCTEYHVGDQVIVDNAQYTATDNVAGEPIPMTAEEAGRVLDAIHQLKKIDDAGLVEKLGFELDYDALLHAGDEATITILNGEITALIDENTGLIMGIMDAAEEREHLREDIQRLINLNQVQAQIIKSYQATLMEHLNTLLPSPIMLPPSSLDKGDGQTKVEAPINDAPLRNALGSFYL